MSKDKIFRMRLDEEYAARLDREAKEEGLSKANLVRKRLGWPLVDRGPQPARPVIDQGSLTAAPPVTVVDPERQPGMSALQQIQERLQKGR